LVYNFFQHVRKKLEERRAELVNALVAGMLPDWSEYKFLAGKLKGLEESLALLSETYRVLADSKDEDYADADEQR